MSKSPPGLNLFLSDNKETLLSTPAKLIQSFLPAVAIVVALQIMNSPEKNWAGTRRKVFKATLVEEVVDDNKKVVGFCLIFRTFCIMTVIRPSKPSAGSEQKLSHKYFMRRTKN